jgi:hypothetical protein
MKLDFGNGYSGKVAYQVKVALGGASPVLPGSGSVITCICTNWYVLALLPVPFYKKSLIPPS